MNKTSERIINLVEEIKDLLLEDISEDSVLFMKVEEKLSDIKEIALNNAYARS